MREEVAGGAGEQGRDRAVDAGAEVEVEAREVVHPGPRVHEHPHLVLHEEGVRAVDRDRARLAAVGRRVAVQQGAEGLVVLGEVPQVRVLPVVRGYHRRHRLHVRRDGHRDPVVRLQGRLALLHPQAVAVQEHRRAADDVDGGEAERTQVVGGDLAPHADRVRAVEHRLDEPLHDVVDGAQVLPVTVDVGLDAHPEHDDGDLEPLDEPGHGGDPVRVAAPERVGQRDDVHVVLLVDAVGVAQVDAELGGGDLGCRGPQKLVRGVAEHQVAAVLADPVALEGLLRRVHVEGALLGPHEDPLMHRAPPLVVPDGLTGR